MPLNRSWLNGLIDDDGSGMTGTPVNKAWAGQFHDVIDAGTVPPSAHGATHRNGGADALALDTLAPATDNTALNASVSAHGLMPKLAGTTTVFMRGDGTWASASGGTPSAHAPTHQAGGTDVLRLDTLGAPTDILTLNVSTTSHGLMPKLSGSATQFFRGDGTWSTPPGGLHAPTHRAIGTDPVDVRTLAGFPADVALFLRGDGVFGAPAGVGFDEVFVGPSDPGSSFEIWYDTDEPSLPILTAHAATHQVGGGDVVDVKLLGGFPGSTTSFLRGDGSFAVPPGGGAGGGNVTGPASATDNAVTRFDGASGTLIQTSLVTIDDAGNLTAVGLASTPLNATNLTTGTLPDGRLSVNVLKFTGGYPGGTTNFLRADGTWAAPAGGGAGVDEVYIGTDDPGGTPGNSFELWYDTDDVSTPILPAHATTHQTGGGDVLNVTLLGGFPGGTTSFLRADGSFATPTSGAGNVVGPASATDNAIARFDTTTGKLLQNSLVTISDTGGIAMPANQALDFGGQANITATTGPFLVFTSVGPIRLSPGSALTLQVDTAATFPTTDAAYDLGTSGNRFRHLYLSGTITATSLGTTPLDAAALTGTVADARLTANVLKVTGGFPGGTTTFLRGDGVFAAPPAGGGGGSGDVVGPATATDNALVRFDTATGKLIQNSAVTMDDSGAMTMPDLVNINLGPSANVFGQNAAGGILHLGAGGVVYIDIGGSAKYNLYPLAFFNTTDAAADLGTSGNRWKDGWFSGTVTAGGLGTTPLNATNLTSGAVPDARLSSNVLKVVGGFPGTISTFLRGDGTFQPRTGVIGFVIDGAGAAITTGVKGFIEIPFAGTITGVTILSVDGAATAGSIVVDLWKDTYANYPPTVADTITASAKPTLSSANKNKDTTLTGWTKTVAAGDILGFNVDSAATVTRVLVSLTIVAT